MSTLHTLLTYLDTNCESMTEVEILTVKALIKHAKAQVSREEYLQLENVLKLGDKEGKATAKMELAAAQPDRPDPKTNPREYIAWIKAGPKLP